MSGSCAPLAGFDARACLTLACHLCSNIGDKGDKGPARAVAALHHHTLSSFENWAEKMHKLKDAYGRADDGRADDERVDPRTQMFEVVLWWCIWGEAANMRFIPEFLSWVFWSLVHKRSGQEQYFGRYENGQGFLRHVMRPMYRVVSHEAFKKDQAGNVCDHSQKKNRTSFMFESVLKPDLIKALKTRIRNLKSLFGALPSQWTT